MSRNFIIFFGMGRRERGALHGCKRGERERCLLEVEAALFRSGESRVSVWFNVWLVVVLYSFLLCFFVL